tara:strand:- start:22596 stop:23138 length:543 start_codon:yes stop_codon:yes gene_type:complete
MIMGKDSTYIYFDGSCGENRNVGPETPAGWGFCVIIGDNGIGKGHGELVKEMSGSVVTEAGEEGYIGATVGSNNTAELSAFAHALRWILMSHESGRVVLRGDSEYAMNVGSGKWKGKANKELVGSVRSLWNEASSSFDISVEHVRAHEGHRWNERADHLAFRAMKGESALPFQFWKPGRR